MTERTGPDWDPRDPSVLGDQQRAYDEMRARCPVAHSDFLGWSLFAHRDMVEAVRDTVTFSSATKRRAIPNGMDPPEHTVYRQVLDPYFTSERMAAFEPRSREIAAALLGPPGVSTARLMELVADWVQAGGASLHKPTHFEVADGKF